MPYLLIFSIAFGLISYVVGYGVIVSITTASMLVLGSIVGKKDTRLLQLHGLTLVLMTALTVIGGFGTRDTVRLQNESICLTISYLLLAIHGITCDFRRLSLLFLTLFWGGVAAGLSHAANERLGLGGIVLSIVLMCGVAFQDIRKTRRSLQSIGKDDKSASGGV